MKAGRAARVALVVGVIGCTRDDGGRVSPSAELPARSASVTPPASATPTSPLTDLPAGPGVVPAARADTLVAPGALRLELLSAGGVPRQPLRTSLRAGRRETLALSADVGVRVATGGGEPGEQPVPRLEVALEAQVVEGDKPSLQVKLVSIAVEPSAPAEAVEQSKALEGLTFSIPLNERGRAGAPSVPAAAGGPVLQLWSTVAEALREMVVPFPAEPVGKGAEWRVFERQPRAGVEMLRRTRYTLVKIEGEELTVRAVVQEVAVLGGVRDPALPDELRLQPIEGSASGEHSWRRPLLDAVLPVESESRLRSRLVTDTHHQLGSARVRGTVELRQTLRAKRSRKDDER